MGDMVEMVALNVKLERNGGSERQTKNMALKVELKMMKALNAATRNWHLWMSN